VIRGSALANYPDLVAELGGDPDQWLRAAGVRPSDVGKFEAFIPFAAAVAAIECAAVQTAPTDFGRRLALRQGIEILGPVGVAARTSGTVADALGIFGTFMSAYTTGMAVNVVATPDPNRSFIEITIEAEQLPPHAHTTELSLGVSLRVLRFLLGPAYAPLSVHLSHEPLVAKHHYQQYFCCRPLFAQSTVGFTIRTADLGRPLAHDQLAHQAVVAYLDTLVAKDTAMTQSVRSIVRHMMPTGVATLEVIAAHFRLHPKALQRRLAAEGMSYAALIDGVRRETAQRYLRDTDITLQHLTRELGYAEQSELSRSCRRWFGNAPTVYRAELRSVRTRPQSVNP